VSDYTLVQALTVAAFLSHCPQAHTAIAAPQAGMGTRCQWPRRDV